MTTKNTLEVDDTNKINLGANVYCGLTGKQITVDKQYNPTYNETVKAKTTTTDETGKVTHGYTDIEVTRMYEHDSIYPTMKNPT